MTRLARLSTLVLLLSAAGCSTDPGAGSARQHLPISTNPNFTMYVSNQSFDREVVDINVEIDGQLAVTGDFDVEGQHSWHQFKFELAPGDHVLTATTDDVPGITLELPFNLATPKYAVTNFWYVADPAADQPAQLDGFITSEPPTFQ